MRSHRKAFPDDFPEGLKPRLRMFLSVDLVGSTEFKQSRQEWRPEILSFYRDFDYILNARYRAFSENLKGVPPAPEFWKSNGDELLYACELQNLSHAHAVIHVWLSALDEYRLKNSQRLDVKSTAWIGLFPIPNSEVFFRRGAQVRADEASDAMVLQSEIRDEWYSNRLNHDTTRDYVGPSIDTGFRLTSWATPRRMIVSVDLAFLLTSSSTGPLSLRFSGREKLKGVIDNEPYPTIWIPVGADRPKTGRDDSARDITDPVAIRSCCEAIIEQNYRSITPLFLAGATYEDFDWVPPYILTEILEHWREELAYKEQLKAGAPPT